MLHVWPFRYDWQQDYPDTLVENLRSRGRLEAKRGHDASHGYSVFKAWWWYGADPGRRCSRGDGSCPRLACPRVETYLMYCPLLMTGSKIIRTRWSRI